MKVTVFLIAFIFSLASVISMGVGVFSLHMSNVTTDEIKSILFILAGFVFMIILPLVFTMLLPSALVTKGVFILI